jgi:hypothetical protein
VSMQLICQFHTSRKLTRILSLEGWKSWNCEAGTADQWSTIFSCHDFGS